LDRLGLELVKVREVDEHRRAPLAGIGSRPAKPGFADA
jgi:hypothetical protein